MKAENIYLFTNRLKLLVIPSKNNTQTNKNEDENIYDWPNDDVLSWMWMGMEEMTMMYKCPTFNQCKQC